MFGGICELAGYILCFPSVVLTTMYFALSYCLINLSTIIPCTSLAKLVSKTSVLIFQPLKSTLTRSPTFTDNLRFLAIRNPGILTIIPYSPIPNFLYKLSRSRVVCHNHILYLADKSGAEWASALHIVYTLYQITHPHKTFRLHAPHQLVPSSSEYPVLNHLTSHSYLNSGLQCKPERVESFTCNTIPRQFV